MNFELGDIWKQHQVACNGEKFCDCTEIITWVIDMDAVKFCPALDNEEVKDSWTVDIRNLDTEGMEPCCEECIKDSHGS